MEQKTNENDILNGTILETYEWYDGPLNFTLLGESGQYYYATLRDARFEAGRKHYDYIYFPTTKENVADLLTGAVSIRAFHIAESTNGVWVDTADTVVFHTQSDLFSIYPLEEWSAEEGARFETDEQIESTEERK